MSMAVIIAHSEDLAFSIFDHLTELSHVLRASETCQEWHATLCHDRLWEPLCKKLNGKGLETGWETLKLLNDCPESRLSWKALFMQRARCLAAPVDAPPLAPKLCRDDFKIGVEVYLLGSRTRVLADAQDDAAVIGALREVIKPPEVSANLDTSVRLEAGAAAGRPADAEDDAVLLIKLAHDLQNKVALFNAALRHVKELFGQAIVARTEWVWALSGP